MFKAGFARVDVTPPFGTPLTGYFALRTSDGILDPIELNAVAIQKDDNIALIITGDFMYITEKTATPIRELISKETGLPIENILTQALHQHTTTSIDLSAIDADEAYLSVLKRKYCDVARMAIDDLKDATISVAEEETATPISFVRRYRMKDGSARTNPGFLNPDILHPLGESDNTVRLVKFSRKDAKDIALVAFQTHPDVIGGNKFSADWPGFTRRITEQTLDNVNCILINGCQGDTNHLDFSKPGMETHEEKYAHSRFMGQTISDVVVKIWNNTKEVEIDRIFGESVFAYVPAVTEGTERVDECKELFDIVGLPENKEKYTMEEIATIRRISRLDNVVIAQKIPVSILTFGNISIVGYGGEAFTEYADVLRKANPNKFILTMMNANGAQGYFPSASAYEEGGYEACSSNFRPVVAQTLQNAALELLKK